MILAPPPTEYYEIRIVYLEDGLLPKVREPTIANSARDGSIAIREEFVAARARGTISGWDLFIARHPASPLIAQARAERQMLTGK